MPRSDDQVDVGAEDAERLGVDDQLRRRIPPAVGGFDVVILADAAAVGRGGRTILRRRGARRPAVPARPRLNTTYTRKSDIRIDSFCPELLNRLTISPAEREPLLAGESKCLLGGKA